MNYKDNKELLLEPLTAVVETATTSSTTMTVIEANDADVGFGRVYFCGEYIAGNEQSTVHGAAISGRTVAEQLIKDVLIK